MTDTRIHATFENAWRLAATMAEVLGRDFAVVRTEDPRRPFVLESDIAHRGVVAVITTPCDVLGSVT